MNKEKSTVQDIRYNYNTNPFEQLRDFDDPANLKSWYKDLLATSPFLDYFTLVPKRICSGKRDEAIYLRLLIFVHEIINYEYTLLAILPLDKMFFLKKKLSKNK